MEFIGNKKSNRIYGINRIISSYKSCLDVIYPRDTWSHRLDICRATNRPFLQTAVHDGRLLALVVRDLARKLGGKLNGRSFIFDINGETG